MGAAARGTKAPKRISSPPTISTAIVAQPSKSAKACQWRAGRNERVRTSIRLCVAVFDEAETDDEPERQGVPACRDWKRRHSKLAKSGGEFHTCRFAAAAAFVTKPVGGFLASSGHALNVRRLATSLQRRLSGGVETDTKGFTRSSYNATGRAPRRCVPEIFTVGTPTRHSHCLNFTRH
jgi:hypothetical protein